MRRIRKGSEVALRDMLSAIEQNTVSWRAICLHIADLTESERQEAKQISHNILEAQLDMEDTTMFDCEDDDVITVCRGVSAKVLLSLCEQLNYLFSSDEHTGEQRVVLLDLSVELETLRSLVDSRIETIIVRNKAAQEEKDKTSVEHNENTPPEEHLTRHEFTILIVEDDPMSLRMVTNLLQKEYHVIAAGTGEEALGMYGLHRPDLVFLDIGLPDMEGHEVLESMRDRDPEAHVIMLSGNSFKDAIMKAMKLGAKGFVGKPFCQEKLKSYITNSPNYSYYFEGGEA